MLQYGRQNSHWRDNNKGSQSSFILHCLLIKVSPHSSVCKFHGLSKQKYEGVKLQESQLKVKVVDNKPNFMLT